VVGFAFLREAAVPVVRLGHLKGVGGNIRQLNSYSSQACMHGIVMCASRMHTYLSQLPQHDQSHGSSVANQRVLEVEELLERRGVVHQLAGGAAPDGWG
jgi:hypothetical protein